MKKAFIYLITIITLLFSTSQALATDINIGAPSAGFDNVDRLITNTLQVSIVVAILFVLGMLIIGGYGWITAGGDKAKVEEARSRITNALIGLAIVAAAYALIVLIGQFFGVEIDNITIPDARPL